MGHHRRLVGGPGPARARLGYTTEQGLPRKGIAGGRGLGGVCDHSNHFGYHIKEILWIMKARVVAMLKGPGENTE